jgi:ATP-binding cassette subfamily F protein uup
VSKGVTRKTIKIQKTISFSFKDKYELEHIEEKILSAEEDVEQLSNKIQQPEIRKDTNQMSKYCSQLEKAQEQAHTLYERWEYLEKIKEQAGS